LNLDVAADHRPAIHIDVLAYHTALADLRALHDMREVPDLRPGANLGSFVNAGGVMCEITTLRPHTFGPRVGQRNFPILQRALAGVEHAQHPEALDSVAHGGGSRLDAFQKMQAFRLQRLPILEIDGLALRLNR